MLQTNQRTTEFICEKKCFIVRGCQVHCPISWVITYHIFCQEKRKLYYDSLSQWHLTRAVCFMHLKGTFIPTQWKLEMLNWWWAIKEDGSLRANNQSLECNVDIIKTADHYTEGGHNWINWSNWFHHYNHWTLYVFECSLPWQANIMGIYKCILIEASEAIAI